MTIEEYQKAYPDPDDAAPGWDAIDAALKPIYGDHEPMHWGTALPMLLGGPDPIDGISVYPCTDGGTAHLHFCTYGFSHLYYDEDAVGNDFSNFGFELTFRLKKSGQPGDEDSWVCHLIQNLARYVFQSGKWFEENHWIPTNSPICLASDTALVGIAFAADPRLSPIQTPHGRVEFLQMFGITQQELDGLGKDRALTKQLLDRHRETNPLLITDLDRVDG